MKLIRAMNHYLHRSNMADFFYKKGILYLITVLFVLLAVVYALRSPIEEPESAENIEIPMTTR